jgi:hypothetical protein
MNKKNWQIYGLRIVGTTTFFYIGRTTWPLKDRLNNHRNRAINGDHYSQINAIFKSYDVEIIHLSESLIGENAQFEEIRWFDYYKLAGHPVVNKRPSMMWRSLPGNRRKSPNHKGKKIRKHTAEMNARKSLRQTGKSTKLKGRHLTDEHKLKLSQANKQTLAIKRANGELKWSDEMTEKQRVAQKAAWERRKAEAEKEGRPILDDEARKNHAEGARKMWERRKANGSSEQRVMSWFEEDPNRIFYGANVLAKLIGPGPIRKCIERVEEKYGLSRPHTPQDWDKPEKYKR